MRVILSFNPSQLQVRFLHRLQPLEGGVEGAS
jgi:hypothetical protein